MAIDLLLDKLQIKERKILTILAVFSVMVLAVYFGLKPSRLPLFLIFGAISFVIYVRAPGLGVITLLLLALCVPIAFGTGTQTQLPIVVPAIPVLLVIWFLSGIHKHNIVLVKSPTNLPLITFVISSTLSYFAGGIKWLYAADQANTAAQIGGYAIFIFSAIVFFLAGNLLQRRLLRVLAWLFIILGAIYMIARWIPIVGNLYTGLFTFPDIPTAADGSLFWVWLVALAGGQLLFNRSLSIPKRFILLAIVGLTLATGWLQGRDWVSGWFPPLIALLAIIWLRNWRVGLVLTVCLAVYMLVLNPGLAQSVLDAKDYSNITRAAARDILLNQVLPLSPVLGLGPSNYYHYAPLFPIMGYNIVFNSHNNYVDILLQYGIVGMVVFLWLMGTVAWLGLRLSKTVQKGFEQAYVYGCLAGLVGTLVAAALGDWFLPFVYNIGYNGFRASILGWLFLGSLVALDQINHKTVDASQASEAVAAYQGS